MTSIVLMIHEQQGSNGNEFEITASMSFSQYLEHYIGRIPVLYPYM